MRQSYRFHTLSGRWATATVVLALAATVSVAPSAHAGAARTAAPTAWTWQEHLSQPLSRVNVEQWDGQSRITDSRFHPAAANSATGYGTEMFAAHVLPGAAGRVWANAIATVPAGARVVLDVRGQLAGNHWTEWTSSTAAQPAILAAASSVVQVRLTLWDNAAGQSPTVSALSVFAAPWQSSLQNTVPFGSAQESYRVFATREGLVGGTTANGHVIVPNDHFVALPSGRALSPQGSDQYSVQVCGPARCETASVWDIGPWNTQDDYWDPSSERQEFQDLPPGTPEAQAAYLNGYNGGTDQFGRTVSNPAGIDLADGTFYNVGLNDNGYVTVTYLFTQ